MLVRDITPNDTAAILEIAHSCDLPEEWEWPSGAFGAVAVDLGDVVAFCALKEIAIYGLSIEEIWCFPTFDGRKGLSALSDWIESVAQSMANDRGRPIKAGGVVRLDNSAHRHALIKRDFHKVADVMAKDFFPKMEATP